MYLSRIFDWGRELYSSISYRRRNCDILPPLRFFLEPTYRCNCNCPFCYVEGHSRREELSTSEWLAVIAQIPVQSFISWEGGEVTLREDFLELLRTSRHRVWGKVNVITNGTVLNPVQLGQLVDIAPLVVSTSLDGLEDTHDRLRGAGKFAHTWDTLERLLFLRRLRWPQLPLLDVKLMLLPETLPEIPALFEKCARLGVDSISLQLRNDHHLKQNAHLRRELGAEFTAAVYPLREYVDIGELRQVLAAVHRLRQRYPVEVRWAPKFTPSQSWVKKCADLLRLGERWMERWRGLANSGEPWEGSDAEEEFVNVAKLLQSGERDVTELYRPCQFPFANLFVNPQGEVYPCLAVSWGNVRRQSLSAIYNGDAARSFRRLLRHRGVFNACQLCCESWPRPFPYGADWF